MTAAIRDSLAQVQARPLDDWHEDYGSCVWWTWENGKWLGEPAWIGGPLDSDWPGYHTHFTPHPTFPPPVNGPALLAMMEERDG
jgi:hypothetical protein